MRNECQVRMPSGICGKPAVDSVPDGDGKFYLCAQHWDEINEDFDEDEEDWNDWGDDPFE